MVIGITCVFGAQFLHPQKAKAQGNSVGSTGAAETVDTSIWQAYDPEVTTVGKAAARAREVLNWSLAIKDSGFTGTTNSKPAIYEMWRWVLGIVIALYVLILIIIAFGMILHLDWAERSRRALPILIIAFIVSTISFSAEVLLIKATDEQLTQNFYTIHKKAGVTSPTGEPDPTINSKIANHLRAQDLLTVGFNYQTFKGFRRVGAEYDEAVKSHLFLVRMTTWTNYVVAFIIVFRIIILWGLVIFSPFMFPFLAFALTRNVAIVWLRQFFFWLFLGPLFALFLTAVPYIWAKTDVKTENLYQDQQNKSSSIPIEVNKKILDGDTTVSTTTDLTSGNIYQSGTNILLSPPGGAIARLQKEEAAGTGNNLSETDSYSRYVIALLMIWGAIILPFLLLRIVSSFSSEIEKGITNVWNKTGASQYLGSFKGGSPATDVATPGQGASGKTKPLILNNFYSKDNASSGTIAPVNSQRLRDRASILKEKSIEKLSVPAILNVAGIKQVIPEAVNFLSAASDAANGKRTDIRLTELTKIEQNEKTTERTKEILEKMASPEKIADAKESATYNTIRESIRVRDVAGEKAARTLQNAISQNVSHYLSTNIGNEIENDAVYRYAQATNNMFNSSNDEIKNQQFRTAYQTNTSNIYEYLSQKQDDKSRLALQTLDQLREAAKLSSVEKSSLGKKDLVTAYQSANNFNRASTQGQLALREIIEKGAKGGDQNMVRFLESSRSVVNVATGYNTEIARHARSLAVKDVVNSIGNFVPKSQEASSALNKIKLAVTTASEPVNQNNSVIMKAAITSVNKLKNKDKLEGQEKNEFSALNAEIEKGVQANDPTAISLTNSIENVSKLSLADQLSGEKSELPESIAELAIAVKDDRDFRHTKELWKEHYRKAQVPLSESIKSRADWLQKEKTTIQANLSNFLSSDKDKRAEALKRIEKILPFILMGDYQASEIASYMLAKYEAAEEVYKEITAVKK